MCVGKEQVKIKNKIGNVRKTQQVRPQLSGGNVTVSGPKFSDRTSPVSVLGITRLKDIYEEFAGPPCNHMGLPPMLRVPPVFRRLAGRWCTSVNCPGACREQGLKGLQDS